MTWLDNSSRQLAMRGGWRRACVGCLEAYTEAVDPRATFCRTDKGTGPPDPNHKTAPDGWHDLLVQGGVYFCRQPPIRADSTKATRKCDRCERLGEDCETGRDLPASWTEVEAPMWRMLEEGIDVFRQQARNVDRPMADKMARLLQVVSSTGAISERVPSLRRTVYVSSSKCSTARGRPPLRVRRQTPRPRPTRPCRRRS